MSHSDYGDVVSFSVENIQNACVKLSVCNCLDCNNLTLKHLCFAHPSLFVWIKELFYNMLIHGFVPEGFGKNVIIPTIKNKNGNSNDASSYKPISIEPIFTKLFKQCLMSVVDPF